MPLSLPNEIKIDGTVRGTRIVSGREAMAHRTAIMDWASVCSQLGYQEIILPSIEQESIYTDKAGEEVKGQIWAFKDKGDRDCCLRPEGTATCQLIARHYRSYSDIKIFYVTRCWRYERPQEGRYREFTQFGLEILNPTRDYKKTLIDLGEKLLGLVGLQQPTDYQMNDGALRGLAYYTDGHGWDATAPILGAQKQILGGGSYAEGIGFAIGLERVILARLKKEEK